MLYDDIEGDQRFWNILAGAHPGRRRVRRVQPGEPDGRVAAARDRHRHGHGLVAAVGSPCARCWSAPRSHSPARSLGVVMTFVVMAAIRPVFESMLPAARVADAVAAGHVRPRRRDRVRPAVRGDRVAGVAGGAGHAGRRDHDHPRVGPQRAGPAAASAALAGERLPPHAARQRAARAAPDPAHRARASARPSTALVVVLGLLDSFTVTMDRNKARAARRRTRTG